ncbi:hypothetical protein C8J57DRAFT_1708361 [Mycena rebaudengoi]|nr:hypothetical protein C8J57DRAFT_1708361 [Mycena rebaudengoi]
MYSEEQPLLPSTNGGTDPPIRTGRRKQTADFLQSTFLHKIVLSLIAIGNCVLADLGYTFLHDGCTPPEGPGVPAWLNVVAHISLGITSFFLLEIPITLWALGTQYFNPFGDIPHAWLHLFDVFIILTTFILEVVLKGREQELASLLIVLRLWRLIKLVGGVTVGVGHIGEEDAIQLAAAQKELEAVKKENEDLRARLQAVESNG